MLTYTFKLFPRIPYLHLTGKKNSGKTHLLSIFEMICKRSRRYSNASPASIFRIVDKYEPTFMLDESENIGNRNRSINIITEILNSGYEKGGKVVRIFMGEEETFKTYCPKIIASIHDLHPTTADRCIRVNMQQAPLDFPKNGLSGKKEAEVLKSEILKQLRNYGETFFSCMTSDFGIKLGNRDHDRWYPILVLAKWTSTDEHNYVERIINLIKEDLIMKSQDEMTLPENTAREIIAEYVEYAKDKFFAEDSKNYLFRADLIQSLITKNDEHNFYGYKGEITSILKRIGISTTRRRKKGSPPISLYVIPKSLIKNKESKDV